MWQWDDRADGLGGAAAGASFVDKHGTGPYVSMGRRIASFGLFFAVFTHFLR
jgi:hypothetical protein